MILADLVAIDSVIGLMLLILAGFIAALIAIVAYFLLKRAKAQKRIAKKKTERNSR